jgi:hypothetical protein
MRWERLSSPAWDDVASAIQRLDGERYIEIRVRCRKDVRPDWWKPPELMIAGGAGGKVLVEQWAAGDEIGDWVVSCVAEPSRGDTTETQIVGAKPVTRRARYWVSRDRAVTAALTYLELGTRDPGLDWEPDDVFR